MLELFRGMAENAKQQIAQNIRTAAIKLALGGMGALAALAALIFFFSALLTALTERFGKLNAELMVGGVFALLALILFVVAARISRAGRANSAPAAAEEEAPPKMAPLPSAIAAFAYGFARGIIRKRR